MEEATRHCLNPRQGWEPRERRLANCVEVK